MTMKLDLPNFADQVRKLVGQPGTCPPVESWNPQREGEIDIHIDCTGKWFYQGAQMEREAVVRLFSSILRLDSGGYCLVTPAEKMNISVEDVPFMIRLADIEGQGEQQCIHVSSNVGDHFTLGAEHPISLRQYAHESVPYVTVRRNLQARLARPVYYALADHVVLNEVSGQYGLWSDGCFFELTV